MILLGIRIASAPTGTGEEDDHLFVLWGEDLYSGKNLRSRA